MTQMGHTAPPPREGGWTNRHTAAAGMGGLCGVGANRWHGVPVFQPYPPPHHHPPPHTLASMPADTRAPWGRSAWVRCPWTHPLQPCPSARWVGLSSCRTGGRRGGGEGSSSPLLMVAMGGCARAQKRSRSASRSRSRSRSKEPKTRRRDRDGDVGSTKRTGSSRREEADAAAAHADAKVAKLRDKVARLQEELERARAAASASARAGGGGGGGGKSAMEPLPESALPLGFVESDDSVMMIPSHDGHPAYTIGALACRQRGERGGAPVCTVARFPAQVWCGGRKSWCTSSCPPPPTARRRTCTPPWRWRRLTPPSSSQGR
jgi:hypothetical protein